MSRLRMFIRGFGPEPVSFAVMGDFTFIALSVAFFAIAILYVHFCDKVR